MEIPDDSSVCALLVSGVNENSVDIYEDLDNGFTCNADNSPCTTAQVKESMDLYEDLVAEEQQSKEASYTELMSRFQAAQNQIKELHKRLEQMETQNTGLNTENFRLKKNISALLKTARQEVIRKDAEIQRLNLLSEKGHHHYNNHREKISFSLNSKSSPGNRLQPHPVLPSSTSSSPGPTPPSGPDLPPLPSQLKSSPSTLPPHSAAPPQKENQRPLSRTESCSLNKQVLSTEAQEPRQVSHSHSSSSSRGSSEIPSKHAGHKSSSSSLSSRNETEKHKSRHREDKYSSLRLSEHTDRSRPRTSSHLNKDSHGETNRSHKKDKYSGQKNDSTSCKNKSYVNAEGCHKSDRNKSPPSERLHSSSSSGNTKSSTQDKTYPKTTIDPTGSEEGTAVRSKDRHGRDSRRNSSHEGHHASSDSRKRKKSASPQHAERYASSYKDKGERQRREEKRHEDKIKRNHKLSTPNKNKKAKRKSKESPKGKSDRNSKETKAEKKQKELRQSEVGQVDENSPNRKLCFMETLNLTISPIKKPALSTNPDQDHHPEEEDSQKQETAVAEEGTNDEGSQLCIEDMCVIDEVDSSDIKAENVAEESAPVSKELISETTQKSCDNAEHVEDTDQCPKDSKDQVLEDTTGQTDMDRGQLQEHADNLETPKSPTPPENSVHQSTEEDISNSVSVVSEAVEVKISASDTSEGRTNLPNAKFEDTAIAAPDLKTTTPETEEVQGCATVDSSNTEVKASIAVEDQDAKKSPGDSFASPTSASILDEDPQKDFKLGALLSPVQDNEVSPQGESPVDADAVSSTISLESVPQEGLSLPEAIFMLTQTNDQSSDCNAASEPSSSVGCIAVSKVSSTTEEVVSPGKICSLMVTPKKTSNPSKSHDNNAEPSSSVPVFIDEDSMMRTLSSLKGMPDAISPLRSPARMTKRSHANGKPGHVKSLQKDFSSPPADRKLDVNKENKYPGSPVEKGSDLLPIPSDTELEEGEILSESDEAVAASPSLANKRAKLILPVKKKKSPKSVLKSKCDEKSLGSKEVSAMTSGSTRSPKSRFKTVCPAAAKASFSTVEEIMETFKLVRSETRKKYMKLHKTFPRRSFYGMMENFQESYLDFVDGANFCQMCIQVGELKSKMKKVITSVFTKVSNNGIVKRIFEQQAVDLKQKLWDFVDVQVDCMFKDICVLLNSFCKAAHEEEKRPSKKENISEPPALHKSPKKDLQSSPSKPKHVKPGALVPYRTGLGSRGKDIRIMHVEKDSNDDTQHKNSPPKKNIINFLPPRNVPLTPDKSSVSLLDKTDFELLTEQQASSLTFNLVTDSQMGEIFKCLLQGSELLEHSSLTGESTSWSLGTPRKEGDRIIGITTPTKFDLQSKLLSPSRFTTPSKIIASWSSISPCKVSSLQTKDHSHLPPSFLDESCLLELPSENKLPQSRLTSEKSFSILAEDLAVSLTMPSPLKSDSHLSFLQPPRMHIMTTPDSVISAHISEDALLDGEDASEQDIHLSLDTDNSSGGSCSSAVPEERVTSFVFKPDTPMQALVMERSNDHFILRIRPTNTPADVTLKADESLSQTLIEENLHHTDAETGNADSGEKALNDRSPSRPTGAEINQTQKTKSSTSKDPSDIPDISTTSLCPRENPTENSRLHRDDHYPESQCVQNNQTSPRDDSQSEDTQNPKSSSDVNLTAQEMASPSTSAFSDSSHQSPVNRPQNKRKRRDSPSHVSDKKKASGTKERRRSEDVPGTRQTEHASGKKQKKHRDESKPKRHRKSNLDAMKDVESTPARDDTGSMISSPTLSPNSLSAKNVVRKKGEVVISWSRDEDRTILLEMKTRGASRETFAALSEKLNKPSSQVAHRFYQLMKLFRKQEKKDI